MEVDILMAISDASGNWLTAEGQTQDMQAAKSAGDTLSSDDLTKDLKIGQLFELDDFSLGLGIEDRDDAAQDKALDVKFVKRLDSMLKSHDKYQDKYMADDAGKEILAHGDRVAGLAGKLQQKSRRKFDDWLSGNDAPIDGFPLDFQAFEFSRWLDGASIELFDACCNSRTLQKAAVVKRKSGTGQRAYLRIDFKKILIVSLNWDVDDEGIKEKVKFICRGATVKYRPQLATGALGPEVEAEWVPVNQVA